jgi:hypothetical protein
MFQPQKANYQKLLQYRAEKGYSFTVFGDAFGGHKKDDAHSLLSAAFQALFLDENNEGLAIIVLCLKVAGTKVVLKASREEFYLLAQVNGDGCSLGKWQGAWVLEGFSMDDMEYTINQLLQQKMLCSKT